MKPFSLSLAICVLLGYAGNSFSDETVRAMLLTPVSGEISSSQPQPVQLKVLTGEAKGCVLNGSAVLNRKRLRYEYDLPNNLCEIAGRNIQVGHIVRGQHNIKGTMANSGMGRDYLLSKKGLEVNLSYL